MDFLTNFIRPSTPRPSSPRSRSSFFGHRPFYTPPGSRSSSKHTLPLAAPSPPPKLSVFSHSLGRGLPLVDKLRAAHAAGFEGVEIFVDDLLTYAATFPLPTDHTAETTNVSSPYPTATEARDINAARSVYRLCQSFQPPLSITCLQPLRDYEVISPNLSRMEKKRQATHYLRCAAALGSDLIMLCANVSAGSVPSEDYWTAAPAELRELAHVAASIRVEGAKDGRTMRIGYEALAWSTHVRSISDAYTMVCLINEPNFGIVLDSFNALAGPCFPRVYAKAIGAPEKGKAAAEERRRTAEVVESVKQIPGDKIFLYQVADGALPPSNLPLGPPHRTLPDLNDPSHPAHHPASLLPFSRTSRLFPLEYEYGAVLPVKEFSDAVKSTGYKGYWSAEVFNAGQIGEAGKEQWGSGLAGRGARAMQGLVDVCYGRIQGRL